MIRIRGRRSSDRSAARRIAIDCWGAALERGDADEIDRLVQESRTDGATSGRIGIMLG